MTKRINLIYGAIVVGALFLQLDTVSAQPAKTGCDFVSRLSEQELKTRLVTRVRAWLEARREMVARCEGCEGSGTINRRVSKKRIGFSSEEVPHPECRGTGFVVNDLKHRKLAQFGIPDFGVYSALYGGTNVTTPDGVWSVLAAARSVKTPKAYIENHCGWLRENGLFDHSQIRMSVRDGGLRVAVVRYPKRPLENTWVLLKGQWFLAEDHHLSRLAEELRRIPALMEEDRWEAEGAEPVPGIDPRPEWLKHDRLQPGRLQCGEESSSLQWSPSFNRQTGKLRVSLYIEKVGVDYEVRTALDGEIDSLGLRKSEGGMKQAGKKAPPLPPNLYLKLVHAGGQAVALEATCTVKGQPATLRLDLPKAKAPASAKAAEAAEGRPIRDVQQSAPASKSEAAPESDFLFGWSSRAWVGRCCHSWKILGQSLFVESP